MNNLENLTLKTLEQLNKLNDEQILKIIEIKKINEKSLLAILLEENMLEEEIFFEILSDIYRRGHTDIDEISTSLQIDQKRFIQYVCDKFKITFFDLDDIDIDYRISEKLSTSQLKSYNAIPVKEDEISVYVAFKNPFDVIIQDKVQNLFNRKLLKVACADPAQIEKYINKIALNESIKDVITEIRKELSSSSSQGQSTESSGILKLIEIILKTSIQSRASDIHIEPTETNCIVRSRIDGMLSETFIFDKDIYPPMVSRMKLLSNMDIAERRRPQDGRFSAQILDKEYDFRISTLPILNGESIVLRILDKSKVIINIEDLGMHPDNFAKFKKSMKAPYGIILVTGPTGSGKTTTLYGALNDIKSVKTKIITVEDPVEYQLNMIQQVHVNEKAGLTFISALRSILRQDPDIIMIGEIRDQETLRIAIQAALTGHLVFSTLHTNDAISALPRMVDMGIEPYLVSGALVCIEAQRLVRKLCPYCKQKVTLSQKALDEIKKFLPEDYQFYKSVGCQHCSQTGYLGREMISEILSISDHIASIVANNASKEELKKAAYDEGFIDMFHDGVIRAANGVTTIEEVYRVAKI
ncbi:general secretion pathway protein GspE [Campylobacter concisus]|jgi:general secretion pathway protein E (type II traffic warden ATPase)(cholera toxin secretion protein epsE)|uniref:Transformation system, type II secretion system ATPase CtsE n=2 Tax=Campylobacter concisus TaxID=199 RepID=A0A0M4SBI4_9BACT|nr:GspE/PulE family protein [Campylobacter concisus]MDO4875674.1 GspE/PulE family protein [Campylobacter sp.]ALF47610.1 transformation system, type II secretion system ATPase CtsE [Campylobacter concisus]ORI04082.1 general secretion pathway protein GspE [Campylobacter concisus]OSQ26286.1 general secretion pathway protein GspE [Campylobacter concisus]QPH84464.1 type II/IV secretion system protein [Campylobacter concisus]